MKNLLKVIMVFFLCMSFFGYAHADYDEKDLDISSEGKESEKQYIKMKDSPSTMSMLRAGSYARYEFEYLFSKVLVGEYRYFPGNDICIRTTPTMTPGGPSYIREFEIEIQKRWSGSKGVKTIYANSGYKVLRWNGVGAGWYRIAMNKTYKQGDHISDYNAVIDNCSY